MDRGAWRLYSPWGHKRVGHDWATNTLTCKVLSTWLRMKRPFYNSEDSNILPVSYPFNNTNQNNWIFKATFCSFLLSTLTLSGAHYRKVLLASIQSLWLSKRKKVPNLRAYSWDYSCPNLNPQPQTSDGRYVPLCTSRFHRAEGFLCFTWQNTGTGKKHPTPHSSDRIAQRQVLIVLLGASPPN